jgi:hypothetical protein
VTTYGNVVHSIRITMAKVAAVSRPQRILALKTGESMTECKRLLLRKATPELVQEECKKLRQTLDSALHRAIEQSEDWEVSREQFKIEQGSFMTDDKNIMVVVACTKVI